MKNRVILNVLIALMFAVGVSCSGGETSDFAVIPLGRSIGQTTPTPVGADMVESYRVIPLETSDSVLLSGRPLFSDVSDSRIVLTDVGTVWFFDPADGSLISKFNRRGNGPGEYNMLMNATMDPSGEKVYVYDRNRANVNVYSTEGRSLAQFSNDSIDSFTIDRQGRFVASYRSFDKYRSLVGIYDSDWTPLATHLYNPPLDGRKVDLWPMYAINIFNGEPHIERADTLYRISVESATPVLVVDKGGLAPSEELTLSVGRDDEKENRIMNNYGYLAGDYYFVSYYYRRARYQEMWNVATGELVYRNEQTGPEIPEGIAFELDGKIVHAWPRFAKDNKVYCFLLFDQARVLLPEYDDDDNPLILEIALR